MKSLANAISFARIGLALSLILVQPLSNAFILIYLGCGISDTLDGYIARKTGTVSKLGEELDSVADLIMVFVAIILLYPFFKPIVSIGIIIWIVAIGVIRLLSILVVLVKFKTFAILHTYGNKITGFLLFIVPLLMSLMQLSIYIDIVCVIASLSALEELFIHLSSNELRPNKKSIFMK
jgi:Phosphatidylserine synthase